MKNYFLFAMAAVAFSASAANATYIPLPVPLPSQLRGNPTTPTDRSGAITIGGTAQQLMGANAARGGCAVQNLSTGDLWVSSIGAASAGSGSWWVPPGSYWECNQTGVPTSAISIYGATTGQTFTAQEW